MFFEMYFSWLAECSELIPLAAFKYKMNEMEAGSQQCKSKKNNLKLTRLCHCLLVSFNLIILIILIYF